MSTTVITFPRVRKVEKIRKPNLFNNNPFSRLLKNLREQRKKTERAKLNFIHQKAFDYYYDSIEFPPLSEVDLPECIYEEKRKDTAAKLAYRDLLDVIADCRVNQCYKKCVKQFKNKI